jgi:hypothetical protein
MDKIEEVAIAVLPAITADAPLPRSFDWSFYGEYTRKRAFDAAQAAATIYERRIAELEGALEPFANLDDANMNDPLSKWLTVGNIKNAVEVLKGTSDGRN